MTKKSPSPSPNSVWRKVRKTGKTSSTSQALRVQASQSPTTSIADIFKVKKKSSSNGQMKKTNSKSSSTMGFGTCVLVRKVPRSSSDPKTSRTQDQGIPVGRKPQEKSSLSLGVCLTSRPLPRIPEPEASMDFSTAETDSLPSSTQDTLSQSSTESGSRSYSKSSVSSGFIRTGPLLPDLSVLRTRTEVGNTVTSTPVEASRSRDTRIQDVTASSPENRTDLDWNFSAIQETLQGEEDLFTITKRRQSPAGASPALKAFKKPKVLPPTNNEEASPVDVPVKEDVMEEKEAEIGLTEQVAPVASSEELEVPPAVPQPQPLPVIEVPKDSRKEKLPAAKKNKKTKPIPAQKMVEEVEEYEELPEVAEEFSTDSEDDDIGISSIRMKGIDGSQWSSSIDCINFSVNRDVILESAYVFKSIDRPRRNRIKLEIYHTSTGEMLLQEIEDCLRNTDVPEIGEMELENPLKLESGRTYTAVLETEDKKSFRGSHGQSLSCCPIVDSMRHLIISYTKPSQDSLEEFLTNTANRTSQQVGQLPGFFFKLAKH